MVVAADAHAGRRAGHRRAAAGVRRLPGGGPQGHRHRAAVHRPARRPASSWACTRSTRSTASGSRSGPPTTCWPTTAPARSWRCPARTSATGTSRQAFDLPIVRTVAAARRTSRARRSPATGRRSTPPTTRSPWTAWTSPRPSRTIIDVAGGARASARGTVNFRLRDWLLSPAALLGCADPDHPLPGRRRGAGARRPAARRAAGAARRRPDAEGRLAAGRRRRTGSTSTCPHVRRPGQARHRHDGHLRRLVVVLPALLLAARRHPGRSTPSWPTRGMPVRPCTSAASSTRAAPAVRALLHQGAARHGPGGLRRAVLGAS